LTQFRSLFTGVVLLAATAVPGAAQDSTDNRVQVSLVTFGPGPLAWERFGHNALWVRDPDRGLDVLYNYGIFDPGEEGFLLTFIRGRMVYWMEPQPSWVIDRYIAANRSVWIQDLNLTPQQRLDLRDFLASNALKENREYRYHYYYDNCSTRIRDAIDNVIGGRIHDLTANTPSGTSYRFQTQRLTVDDIPLYTGLLIALGNPVDKEMSAWEEMFLPLAVRDRIRDVTVLDESGVERPLVAAERVLNLDPRYDGATEPPHWLFAYLTTGMIIAGLIAWLGMRPDAAGGARRTAFVVTGGLWCLIVGAGGVVLLFLWAITDHSTSYWNENLFFFNPAALVVVGLLPFMRRGEPWLRAARMVVAFVAVTGLLGMMLQVLPGIDQVNGQIIALVLPANLAVALVVLRGSHSPSSPRPTVKERN